MSINFYQYTFKSEFCYEENTMFLIKGEHHNHLRSFVKKCLTSALRNRFCGYEIGHMF